MDAVQYMFDYFHLAPHLDAKTAATVLYGLYFLSLADGSANGGV